MGLLHRNQMEWKMDGKLLARIKALTALNDHCNAYLLAARELGLEDLAQRFESINRQKLALGELPWNLYEERSAAYREMMAYAKSHMSPSDYKRFYGLF